MTSLLRKVKSRLFLQSRRHALHQLDGQYSSKARGRGTDFDDLREYAHGDDVRDIDWKATARSAMTLLRRYHPERRHVVTFVVNTGRSMSAVTRVRQSKGDLAITIVGSLAYLATKHGDDVGLLYRGKAAVERLRPGKTDAHLERMLRSIQVATNKTAARSDFGALLSSASSSLRHRGIVVCVSDESHLEPAAVDTLRALATRHDVLWVGISDGIFGGNAEVRSDLRTGIVDVDTGWRLPAFLVADREIARAVVEVRSVERQNAHQLLTSLGIVHVDVHGDEDVLPGLVALLRERGAARG